MYVCICLDESRPGPSAIPRPMPPPTPTNSAEDTVIPAGGKGLVKTELSIAIPRDTYARIGACGPVM